MNLMRKQKQSNLWKSVVALRVLLEFSFARASPWDLEGSDLCKVSGDL